MKKLFLLFWCFLSVIGISTVSATTYDSEGYPVIYLRGSMTGGFAAQDAYKFQREGNNYSLTLASLNGEFKIADDSWGTVNHFYNGTISGDGTYTFKSGGSNSTASGLANVTISFTIDKNNLGADIAVTFSQGGSSNEELDGYYVLFENTKNWTKPCIYAWVDGSGTKCSADWPGDQLTHRADGKWYWKLPEGKPVPTHIIFNNNNQGAQTDNLDYVNGATYKADGTHTGGTVIVSHFEPTGTLPVLYINVYTDADKTALENEIISKDLAHKNYFSNAEYWIDMKDCQWLKDLGAEAVGSEDEPLPLEIKARGNFTRKGYSKKPFKLKLGSKQNLLKMNANGKTSKHWAILAHADDSFGYLRNFTGFRLGEMIGLPWTPRQQPIEVVINGDYRGIYFLTESIRVGEGRVPITELDDEATDPALISGGYLVELDNYIDDCTFALNDASNKNKAEIAGHPGHLYGDLMVTADTPETLSDIQLRFLKEQFTTMNNLVNSNDDNELWSYLELDDAARYYVVEEILSHYEAYHGSTYMFRDRGNGKKWHFTPLWDCGHAFDGPANAFFSDNAQYGNNWIGCSSTNNGLRKKANFMDKVKKTFQWFVNKEADGSASPYERLCIEIDDYVNHISAAAVRDAERWAGQPLPDASKIDVVPEAVIDNSDIASDKAAVKDFLNKKITWLKGQWGSTKLEEPKRDTTPAAPLPDYANPDLTHYTYTIYVKDDSASGEVKAWIYDDECVADHDIFGDTWNGKQVFTPKTAGDGSTYYSLMVVTTRELVNPKVKIICGGSDCSHVDFVDGRFYDLNGHTVTDFDPDYVPQRSHVYFNNTVNWSNPCVWAWVDGDNCNANGKWPGDAMTLLDDGRWYWELPAGKPNPTLIIFSNNGNDNAKTGNLEYINDATYKADGTHTGGTVIVSTVKPTGTLPVLYINVYTDADKTALENEIISKDLDHKNYFSNAEYWIDMKDCQWLKDLGAEAVGSEDEPLPLQIKARGNFTRKGYSKKPFKLKLDKKQNLLNMNANGKTSKHWAILAHADDSFGYMRNFTGFRLGEMIGLPWTPRQQPIEVVINGDYRGIYFLTESIRVGDGRVPITELNDKATDPALISGGYLVELDNYIDDCTFALEDASNKNPDFQYGALMVTADTPEELSDIQLRFLKEQFTTMNSLVNSNDDSEIWSYLELDDAARYYVVEEILSHYEAYHGSTYLFRDHGAGNKWHFSPLWDCGHAFDGPTNRFFPDMENYNNHTSYGNTWIGNSSNKGLRGKANFMDKVKKTFQWFINKEADGSASPYERLQVEIDDYVNHISAAAARDAERWAGQPRPNKVGDDEPQPVVNNTDIADDKTRVLNILNTKINWLKEQWGSSKLNEPERDTTPAAPLPDYANPDLPHFTYTIYVKDDSATGDVKAWIYDDECDGSHDIFGDTWNGTQVFNPQTAGDGSIYYSLMVVTTRELVNPKVKIICGGSSSNSVDFVDGRFYDLNGNTVTDFDPDYVPEPYHIYVINDAGWATVSMWLYSGTSQYSTTWPGVTLEINNELIVNGVRGVYDFKIPAAFNNGNVIFSNAGDNQYPEQNKPGLQLEGKDYVYYTSNHSWGEPTSVETKTPWSKTLPLVRITTPAAKEIGYGDAGAVKKSTFELDALDLPGVTAIAADAAGDVTVKGRGKSYWDTYEKKSYKLKFKNKVSVLDMPKSKHWVLMPYANDAAYGLLANFTGHELSRLIGLEWTPAMQPVEVVINDEYVGLYFIAENVRAAADRVQIADYPDATYSEEDDFLLEFSSAHEDDGTELFHSWTSTNGYENKLITATPAKEDIATPEEMERIQQYLAAHAEAIENAVTGAKNAPMSTAWTDVIDYEQAAKYYVVQEIMDDMSSFDDNFYMHHTTGSKWILGPVWDFGNAFASDGNKESLIHNHDGFKGSFIHDLYTNRHFIWFTAMTFIKFNEGQTTRRATRAKISIQENYNPEMAGTLDQVNASIDDMVDKIQDAAVSDAARWPEYAATSDEKSLTSRAQEVKANLAQSKEYLTKSVDNGGAGWTEDGIVTAIDNIVADGNIDVETEYFDVMGRRVVNPQPGSVVIVRRGTNVTKKVIK